MSHRQVRPLLLLSIAAVPLAHAQEVLPTPASPEACVAISSDAARLACYDQALSRRTADPQAADAAAKAASERQKQQLDASVPEDAGVAERTRQRAAAIFKQDRYDSTIANAGKGSLLDSRWELAKDSKLGTFQLRAYKPVYLLPAFWTSKKNELPSSPNPVNTVTTAEPLDSVEAKFQLSFKTKIVENIFGDNGDLWGAYTQSSRWQVYNSEQSRPFRETNYEPELMLVFRNNYSLFGWKGRMTGIQLTHQSNGRSDPLSRSWNRAMLNIGLDRDNWALVLRPWYRIPESRKQDNNPDIEDYMGRGDATLIYNRNGHEVALMARHSLRGGDRSHGAVQLDWGFPISNLLRGHVQVFDGYGESMIDYNHRATYVGVGISLLEWF
ncbi:MULTISPECIES: phospholipase A [Xanthomonas]|uniref:Phospholipase A1 n=1 Tax=Xanthomonas sacchari TaxID=56458 RepID=A0AA46PUK7_9XANT|nr:MULTISPECIES: phospholipase A [Xanthomonas]MCW0366330.1 putative phospholipase A1 [Xanthomonas sacchari]MCW0392861.1 putative phospholipase A1 [Xanthomonas sacchari]MCW0402324.1 putative phospholipase A1 [Xanthomonas sacchari]MCW0416250.1 putative phospholipase A1 [Xanthomonas sacchari]MCW0440645.1 putative phospholipase A1 [Xanthomonas sacchari]